MYSRICCPNNHSTKGISIHADLDGYIANHPYRDLTFVDGKACKIAKDQARKPSDPSPFIDCGAYIRYMMISMEYIEAQEGWVRAGKLRLGHES